jgi:hypothetical protein
MAYSLSTQAEAQSIAKAVEKYWAMRGYSVRAEVVKSDQMLHGDSIFTVHSDLVNGFPKDMPRTLDAVWALREVDRRGREKAAA